jgi:hypothetical protein
VNTHTSRGEARRAGLKDLLVVSFWSAIGLGSAVAMAWFGLGYILNG